MPLTRGAKLTELSKTVRQTRSKLSSSKDQNTPKSAERGKTKSKTTPKQAEKGKNKDNTKKSSKEESKDEKITEGKPELKDETENVERRSPVQLEIIYDGSDIGKKVGRKRSTDEVISGDDSTVKKKHKDVESDVFSPSRRSSRGLIPKRFDDMQYEFGKKAEDKYLIYGVKTPDTKKKTAESEKRSVEAPQLSKRENKGLREQKVEKSPKKKKVRLLSSEDRKSKAVKKHVSSSPHMEYKKKKHKNGKELKSRVDVSDVQLLDINLISSQMRYDQPNILGSLPKQKVVQTKKLPLPHPSIGTPKTKLLDTPVKPLSNVSVPFHMEERQPKTIILSSDTMNNFRITPVTSLADKNIVEISRVITPEQLQGKTSRTIPFEKRSSVLERHLVGDKQISHTTSPQSATKDQDSFRTSDMQLIKSIKVKLCDPLNDNKEVDTGSKGGITVDMSDEDHSSNVQKEPTTISIGHGTGSILSNIVRQEVVKDSASPGVVQSTLNLDQGHLSLHSDRSPGNASEKDVSDFLDSRRQIFKSILKPNVVHHQGLDSAMDAISDKEKTRHSGNIIISTPTDVNTAQEVRSQSQISTEKTAGHYTLSVGSSGIDTTTHRTGLSFLEKELSRAIPREQELLKEGRQLGKHNNSIVMIQRNDLTKPQITPQSSSIETSANVSCKEPTYRIVPVSGIKQTNDPSTNTGGASDGVKDHRYSADVTRMQSLIKPVHTKPSRFVYQSTETIEKPIHEAITSQPAISTSKHVSLISPPQTTAKQQDSASALKSESSLTGEQEKQEKMKVVRVSVGPDGNLVLEECDSADYVKEQAGSGFKLTEKADKQQPIPTSSTVLDNTVIHDTIKMIKKDDLSAESTQVVVVEASETVEPLVTSDNQEMSQLTGLDENIVVINLPDGVDPQSLISGNHRIIVDEQGQIQTSDVQLATVVTDGLSCPSMITDTNLTVISDEGYAPFVTEVSEMAATEFQSSDLHSVTNVRNDENYSVVITDAKAAVDSCPPLNTEASDFVDSSAMSVGVSLSNVVASSIESSPVITDAQSLIINADGTQLVTTSDLNTEKSSTEYSDSGTSVINNEGMPSLVMEASVSAKETEPSYSLHILAPVTSEEEYSSETTNAKASGISKDSFVQLVTDGSDITEKESELSTVQLTGDERCPSVITDGNASLINDDISPLVNKEDDSDEKESYLVISLSGDEKCSTVETEVEASVISGEESTVLDTDASGVGGKEGGLHLFVSVANDEKSSPMITDAKDLVSGDDGATSLISGESGSTLTGCTEVHVGASPLPSDSNCSSTTTTDAKVL